MAADATRDERLQPRHQAMTVVTSDDANKTIDAVITLAFPIRPRSTTSRS